MDDDLFDVPMERKPKPLQGVILPPDDDFDIDLDAEREPIEAQDLDAWKTMTPTELRTKGPDGLTPKQRAFVYHYLHAEGNASAAARACGFEGPSAAVAASRWLRTPAVIDALRVAVGRSYIQLAPSMIARMQMLALSAKSEFVQQQAAKDLLDRMDNLPDERRGPSVRIAIDLG